MSSRSPGDGPWVLRRKRPAGARLRLFCLPYAGGGAGIFHAWSKELPAWIEVVPVLLPGRDRRLREAPVRNAREQAAALADGLAPHLEPPFALFGHSMGALLAYELTRELVRLGRPTPTHLFAAGFRAPHLADPNPPLHALDEALFLRAVAGLDGTPSEVLADVELVRLFLPTLRADLELVESYVWSPGVACPCPITVFGARGDPLVSKRELCAWSELTAGESRTHVVEGGHFFLEPARAEILAAIARALEG